MNDAAAGREWGASSPARRVVGAVLLTTLAVWLGACSLLYRSPTVRLVDVHLVGVGLTSGNAQVHLEVDNPNLFALEVREFRYRLEVSERGNRWTELANGSSLEPVTLPRRSRRTVALDVPFRYGAVGSALWSWFETGEIRYRIQGDVKASGPRGEMDLPFRSQGAVSP